MLEKWGWEERSLWSSDANLHSIECIVDHINFWFVTLESLSSPSLSPPSTNNSCLASSQPYGIVTTPPDHLVCPHSIDKILSPSFSPTRSVPLFASVCLVRQMPFHPGSLSPSLKQRGLWIAISVLYQWTIWTTRVLKTNSFLTFDNE